MCSKNIHNFVCCWLFALKNINWRSQIVSCLPSQGEEKNFQPRLQVLPSILRTHILLKMSSLAFFFFNHQKFCKWILFRDNSIINIIFMVKLLTSKFLSNSQAKNWFYPSYFEYIVIHWMPESNKSIKDKSVKNISLKKISY